jgi:hypothetical protein
VVSFRKDAPRKCIWACSRWIFGQLAIDVVTAFPDDAELISEMRSAEAVDGLCIHKRELATRVAKAIRQVAVNVIEGKIPLLPDTPPSQDVYRRHYLEAMSQLVTFIDAELPVLEGRVGESPSL